MPASAIAEGFPAPLPVTALSGKQINLPTDLPDKAQLFIIGFSHSSRQQSKAWVHVLHETYGTSSGIDIHQVAVLDTLHFIRGFIIDHIRDSIPKQWHGTFMLATTKIDAWKKLAGFKQTDLAYLVLLNRKHEITWRYAGAFSRQGLRTLKARVASVTTLTPSDRKLQTQESFSSP